MIRRFLRLAALLLGVIALPSAAIADNFNNGAGKWFASKTINGIDYPITLCGDPVTGLAGSCGSGGGSGGSISGKANAAAPTYTENQTTGTFMSFDLAGGLRTRNDNLMAVVGATGDSAYTGTGSATLDALLKGIFVQNKAVADALGDTTTPSPVKIDHSAPGVSDGVVVTALPATAASGAKQDTANTSLASIDAKLTSPLVVGGQTVVVGSSITRPADTAAYALGDIVGPATGTNCGGAVTGTTSGTNGCAIYFVAARNTTGSGAGITGSITGARLSTTLTSIQSFRIHYFRTAPTITASGIGDNSAYTGNVPVVASTQFCVIDITTDDAGSDGAKGEGAPSRNLCSFTTASGGFIYAIIEVRSSAGFTPTSGGVYTLATEIQQD